MGMSSVYFRFDEETVAAISADPHDYIFGLDWECDPDVREIMLDIDQSWQGIAQLFAGRDYFMESEGTLAEVIVGGEVLAVTDGIAFRLFRPSAVERWAVELDKVTDEQFKLLYDPAKTSEREDALNDYLLPHYKALVQFFVTAAKHKQSIITYIW